MSTRGEAELRAEDVVEFTVRDPRYGFVVDFGKCCFVPGEFRSQDGTCQRWQLDCRRGLGDASRCRAIARELQAVVSQYGVTQVAGIGFGSYLLIGALLGLEDSRLRAGLIRPVRKTYGCRRLIEGDLDCGRPVAIVDDIINSGESALRAVESIRAAGFQTALHISIFNFRWGAGEGRLAERGVRSISLVDVARKQEASPILKRRRGVREALRRAMHSARQRFSQSRNSRKRRDSSGGRGTD